MSEVNPEDLVEDIEYEVDDAEVIPTPIDPTLTIEGEAADAKATGDAIAGVVGNIRINGKSASGNAFSLYATDMPVSDAVGAQSVAQVLDGINAWTADSIPYDAEEDVSVKAALDDVYEQIGTGLDDGEIDDILDEVFGEDE